MPRTEKQKLKLCLVIDLFKRKTDSEHPISVTGIIDYLASLGVTAERKSVYRDISAMQDLGYEIIQVHNKHFMYYLANRDFETAELKMLVDAVQASRFITKRKSNELIKKLESLTTEYDANQLQSQVFVTNRIKTSNESIYYNVDAINYAINENLRITFTYFDWDIHKRRKYRNDGRLYEVSPWALIWHNENYYLIAYDGKAGFIKHYRVDRMMSIDCTDTKREGKDAFKEVDVAKYAKKFFGMYNGEIINVTLRCASELTNAVIDMFGTDVRFRADKDEKTFEIDVEVALSPVFFSWVFMFGGKVEILSPDSAAQELKRMAEKFID
ncbi:MAG: WYL domain-containing protein [Oscillospiraceae bacterium]|nr:WYL domain-containing protein [Oscillospiraceae bacterium]